MNSWYKHIDGAAALLKLRGERQFDDELGILLFCQFRTQIVRFIPRLRFLQCHMTDCLVDLSLHSEEHASS